MIVTAIIEGVIVYMVVWAIGSAIYHWFNRSQ